MERALQAMVPGREDWAYLFQTPLALAIYATGAAVMVLFFWATRKGRGMGTRVDPRFVAQTEAVRLLRSLKIVVPVVVLGCVLAFWIMFTRVAPILQFRVWLL